MMLISLTAIGFVFWITPDRPDQSAQSVLATLCRRCLFCIAWSVALFGLGCGASSETNMKKEDTRSAGSEKVKVLKWGVRSVMPPRTLKIGDYIGYCAGDPKPRISSPQIKYRGVSVYIKLEVRRPRDKPSDRERAVCGGVELFVGRTVMLKHDLAYVRVYDDGVDPPELRWPR